MASDSGELGNHAHTQMLVKCTAHKKSCLVRVPVEATNGLGADILAVDQLNSPRNTHPLAVWIFYAPLVRVVILVHVQSAVARTHHADITILGEVLIAPNGCAADSCLCDPCKSLPTVLSPGIKDMKLTFQTRGDHLVHFNILSVKLHPTYSISNVGLPSNLLQHTSLFNKFTSSMSVKQVQASMCKNAVADSEVGIVHLVHSEIVEFDVPIIITSQHTSLFIVEGVAKCNGPTVSASHNQLSPTFHRMLHHCFKVSALVWVTTLDM
jgi:hypothetical protein